MKGALSEGVTKEEDFKSMVVFNTSSWERTDLVTLPQEIRPEGSQVKDKDGKVTPIQVLKSGETVFLAEDVPPMGSKIYYWDSKPSRLAQKGESGNSSLESEFFTIEIDPVTGAVSRIYDKSLKKELVDDSMLPGVNAYYYVAGRDPSQPRQVEMVKVKVMESGPVISSLLIAAQAPGCNYLSREIRLIHGLHRLEIINRINKTNVFEPEGVYMAFPFSVPEGTIRYDLGYAVCRVEDDQLPGACRNYITVENWADVSNEKYGITLVSPDVPIVEIGEISTDATVFGWIEKLQPSQTLYSYVMNNYWETNYKASQQGEFTFRYILLPHEEFNAAQAERMAIQQRHPLIAVPGGPEKKVIRLFPLWDHPAVNLMNIIPSDDGKGTCLTLFNSSLQPAVVEPRLLGGQVYRSDFDGSVLEKIKEEILIPGMGMRQVVVY
jgi:alpha-mannosidase